MPNAVKYWNGSSWQSPGYFGQTKMWDGSSWRMVQPKVYHTSISSWSFTLTVGYLDQSVISNDPGLSWIDYTFGYYLDWNIGAVTDNNFYATAGWSDSNIITGLYYNYNDIAGVASSVALTLSSSGSTNWNTLDIGGTSYSRTSATLSGSTYSWDLGGAYPGPFGSTSGVTKTITFS